MIDKSNTALIIIDLQKGIVSVPRQPYSSDVVITNAVKLARAFRKNHMPVFLVRVSLSQDGKDRLQPLTDNKMQAGFQREAEWAEIVPALGPENTDLVITKRQWGAFYGTELDLQLRRRKIETIILCGISTHLGVESTARFAYEYGYQQIFAEDACSASSNEEHEHTMKYIFTKIGRIHSTEQILADLE
jgi:nicotinamidase-related amidase